MNIFKGYVRSIGKVPIDKLKDENYLPEPPMDHDYCGVLQDDIIQIDFDNEKDSKIALEIVEKYKLRCNILKTTRGIHLYFKNTDKVVKRQSVGIYNAIGLQCDVGLGDKYRAVPLRVTSKIVKTKMVNGEEVSEHLENTTTREWIQEYDDIEELPSFFRPIGTVDYNLRETTARNNTLYKYIIVLQSNGFTRTESRKTIKIINEFVLYEPLSDREIDIITRDEAFSEEIFLNEKGKFLHDRFGDYMLANANILLINDQLHIYNRDNIYSNNPDDFERFMINKIPQMKDTQRKEVYKYVALKCTKRGEYSSPKYIGLKDFILDIETMEQYPYSPSFIIQNKIPFNYNPNAYHETMDKTLNKVCGNNKDTRKLLEEMIGYSLYRGTDIQMCFILTGEGSNGKSTIMNSIKRLLGRGNYTSLDMKDLEDTFRTAELHNKLANVGDDISAKYLEESSVFKKVVSGETVMVERKFAHPFEMESYATQIFSANLLPPVADKSDGFHRRITILPFNAKFSKNDSDYDPFINDKLQSDEAMEYLLKIAIDGLKDVIFNKKFTNSSESEKAKMEYIKSNNNILEWFDDDPKLENESVNDSYMKYKIWCVENGYNAVKKGNLSREIKKVYGLVSKPQYINGKTVRVYKKEE